MEPVEKCDNCGKDFPESKINSHFGYCRRNIKRCELCKEMVDINYLEEHNQDFHTKQACKHCRKQLPPQELTKHESVCPSRPKFCEYCELDIAVNEFDKHVSNCGSRTKLCARCEKNVLLREYDVHTVSCRGKVAPPPPPPPVPVRETVPREVQKRGGIANRQPQQLVPPANQYRPEAYMYKPDNVHVEPPSRKPEGVIRHNIPPNSNKVVNGGGQDYFKPQQPIASKQGGSRGKQAIKETKPEEKRRTNMIPERNERPVNPPTNVPTHIPAYIPPTNVRTNDRPRQQATTTTTTTTNNVRREPQYPLYEQRKQLPQDPPRRTNDRPVVQPPVYEAHRNPDPPAHLDIDEDQSIQRAIEESMKQNKKLQGFDADFEMDHMSQSFYRDMQMQDHIENSLKSQKAQQPARRR